MSVQRPGSLCDLVMGISLFTHTLQSSCTVFYNYRVLLYVSSYEIVILSNGSECSVTARMQLCRSCKRFSVIITGSWDGGALLVHICRLEVTTELLFWSQHSLSVHLY